MRICLNAVLVPDELFTGAISCLMAHYPTFFGHAEWLVAAFNLHVNSWAKSYPRACFWAFNG